MFNKQLKTTLSAIVAKHMIFAGKAFTLEHIQDETIETACTNGVYIKYNSQFFNQLTFEQRKTLVCHEVLHVLFGHHLRMRGRDPELWNSACDYVINLILKEAGFQAIDGWLYDPKYRGMCAEDVYSALSQKSEKEQEQVKKAAKGSGGSFEEPKGANDQPMTETELERAKEASQADAMAAAGMLDKQEKAIQQSKALTDQTKREMLREIGSGFSTYRERLADFKHSRIDWKYVINQFLNVEVPTHINEDAFDFYSMENSDFEMVINERKSKEFGKVIFASDVSGSLFSEAKQIASEALECLQLMGEGELHLIQVSNQIHSSKVIQSPEDIQIVVGGGTCFKPLFNEELPKHEYETEGLIFVTDGVVNTENWQKPPYPVLWILTRANTQFEQNVPFGDVVRFN